MKKRNQPEFEAAYLDELIARITVDANTEDEQLWAFRQAFEDDIPVPCDAKVIGEPVQVAQPKIIHSTAPIVQAFTRSRDLDVGTTLFDKDAV